MDQDTNTVVDSHEATNGTKDRPPQANPKLHPVDWIVCVVMFIGATEMFANDLPPKYAGPLMALYALARLYTKWFASRQLQEAMTQGQEIGNELKNDFEIMGAKRAQAIEPRHE